MWEQEEEESEIIKEGKMRREVWGGGGEKYKL